MIIFDEPKTAPYLGLILSIVFFVIQLLLCFKVKNPIMKRIPIYFIIICGLFILLICTGIFGTGSGFMGNVHLIVAAILAIVVGIALIGIVAAWIVYKICMRKKK